jgi:starch phosphorylase
MPGLRLRHPLRARPVPQRFVDGRQVEEPETWLSGRHAWEFERPEAAFEIGFGGSVLEAGERAVWQPDERVIASAHDTPIIGWQGHWANTLRLWSAKPTHIFDLERFNRGEYAAAAEPEALARTISRVLYPDDTTDQGKTLRLKQEYFFTAASLRDILRRFLTNMTICASCRTRSRSSSTTPTRPSPGRNWCACCMTTRGSISRSRSTSPKACLSYTNHTLLPEALERWSEGLMGALLPRHMKLIERIDDLHARRNPTRKVVGPRA